MGTDDEVVDHREVVERVTQYHRSVDYKDWDLFRDIVTDDVEWVWSGSDPSGSASDRLDGREPVLQWLQVATSGATPHHHTTNHLVQVEGGNARTHSYMHVVDRNTLATLAVGTIACDLVKTGSRWQLARIEINETMRSGAVQSVQPAIERRGVSSR